MKGTNKKPNFYDQRDRFEQTPDRYAELMLKKPLQQLLNRKASDWQKAGKSINYLDVGCGNGAGAKKFSVFLQKTTGMDVEVFGADASAQCQSSCDEKGVTFSCLDFNLTRLPINNIHVMTVFETIEHIFEVDFLLESIHRSLSSDGVVLITTLNVVCWKNRLLVPFGIQPFNTEVSTQKLWYGYKLDALKKRMDTWKPAGHIRPFTLHSLCDILEDKGFEVVDSMGLENWRAFKFLEAVAKNMCTGILVIARPVS